MAVSKQENCILDSSWNELVLERVVLERYDWTWGFWRKIT